VSARSSGCEPPVPASEVPVTGRPVEGAADEAVEARPRARRRWPRRVLLGVAVVALLAVLWYLLCLFQVWSTGHADDRRPVDAIVVLGAAQYDGRPSPLLESRLEHALALYREGVAPRIVTTGGKLPADRFTEAQASANWLIERGVPDDAILREVQGTTTWESLAATARILRNRGLGSVVLVSDPFHSLRIKETAEELGLRAHVSPTRTSPIRGGAAVRRMVREAAGVSVARLPGIGYRRLLRITE
jgi:uncharacterized SAM-binding protein YcdF (DUF218 family)